MEELVGAVEGRWGWSQGPRSVMPGRVRAQHTRAHRTLCLRPRC